MFRRERGVPLAAPDVAKVSSAQSFAECACTPARLEQGIDELFIKTGRGLEMSGMGDMIKWVQGDILSEEADTLRENGLHARDVLKPITSLVREWFTQRMRQGT